MEEKNNTLAENTIRKQLGIAVASEGVKKDSRVGHNNSTSPILTVHQMVFPCDSFVECSV